MFFTLSSSFRTSLIALQTSRTIFDMAWTDTLKSWCKLVKLSPDAKYLSAIARRYFAGIAFLKDVSCLVINGEILFNNDSKSV